MARKRLTRKEIVQEDQIQATLTRIWDWSSENRNFLVAVFALGIAAILGFYAWSSQREARIQALQTQFSEALEIYHAPLAAAEETSPDSQGDSPQGPGPTTESRFQSEQVRQKEALERFQAIAKDSPDTDLGLLSSYYVALIHKESDQIEEAKQILMTVVEKSSEPRIQNLARNQLGLIARSEGEYQQAVQWLEGILESNPSQFPEQSVLFELARTHESAGNREEALRYYQRLRNEFATSQYAQDAGARIERLESQAP